MSINKVITPMPELSEPPSYKAMKIAHEYVKKLK